MVKALRKRINSRIALKLALWVIVFSTFISLITTAVQLYIDYRQDLNGIKDYFQSITIAQLNTISQSVWIMDDNQIEAQLNGITKGRDIIFAAIVADDETLWYSGKEEAQNTLEFHHDLPYTHRSEKLNLGQLKIVASLDNLRMRLFQRAAIILLTNILKTFLFAGFILLFFQRAVTRHLEKLASYVVNMDFRKKLTPLKLDRALSGADDEFNQVVNMLNIFQRRGFHAFNALEKSEMRLRLFFDATEEGIFGINIEGRVTFVNSTCLATIGAKSSRAIIGRKVRDVFSYTPAVLDPLTLQKKYPFTAPMLSNTSFISDDGFFEVKDGPSFYASVRTYPIVADGQSTGAVVFFNDNSEQREMLNEKNLLSQAVRQSPLMVIILDAGGIIEYVNPEFERLTGYRLKEVINQRPYVIGGFLRNKKVYRNIRKTLATKQKWQGVYKVIVKNRAERSFDTLVTPVFNSRGKIVNMIALCLDITQKIELQNQLNHAQKMEAVGRLSASFAHEFGNPLLGVRSVIKDISDRIEMEKGDRQLLKLAYGECERMKVLIRDFQQFQRVSSGEKDFFDIHEILDNVLFFYKKHFEKNNIILSKEYDNSVPNVFVSKDQIAQVFLNLIINAVDAMASTGGDLIITTRSQDDIVSIEVRDSGIGVEEGNKELIFEPFFTTKPEVHGTGLGLSISYGIVAGHGGEITFSSKINEGTRFVVQLPSQITKN